MKSWVMIYKHNNDLAQLPKPCVQPLPRFKRIAAVLLKKFLRFIVK